MNAGEGRTNKSTSQHCCCVAVTSILLLLFCYCHFNIAVVVVLLQSLQSNVGIKGQALDLLAANVFGSALLSKDQIKLV
jgi:hypothetical protein